MNADRSGPARVLVVSEEKGEGALIAEMATADPTRTSFAIKGSKLIANSNWYGGDYKLNFSTPEQLAEKVERLGIRWIVFDRSVLDSPRPEHDLAWKMLASDGERFIRDAEIDAGRQLVVFRVSRAAHPPLERIEYELARSVGMTVRE